MTLEQRIEAFARLGKRMQTLSETDKAVLFRQANDRNAWFTPEQNQRAWNGILHLLNDTKLADWTKRYALEPAKIRPVGVAMAGNIPMVGFHDFLSVLISGHHLVAKTSSQDDVLIPFLANQLLDIEPGFRSLLSFEERLNGVEALIATGSDNTSRYFEYYFRSVPHIIRKNRSSCAIIMGDEPTEALKDLGHDVFAYFGLGCRNVSKLYLPEDFDAAKVLDAWQTHASVANHHKYVNNYDYNKSIFLVGRTPFLDNGFVLVTESASLVSPISVVYYETYRNQQDLREKLNAQQSKVQCVVAANGWYKGSVPFGKAQLPELWDFADGVDTLQFLSNV